MTLPIDLTVTADLTLTVVPLHDITNGFDSNCFFENSFLALKGVVSIQSVKCGSIT